MHNLLTKTLKWSVLVFSFLASNLYAQPWTKFMDSGDKESFEEAKNQFKEYWKDKDKEKEKSGH